MAQGGLNAALSDDEGDSPELHARDTIKGAAGLASEKMVLDMCRGAKECVEWLDSIGMPFSSYDNCLKEDIEFLDDRFVMELIVEDSTCKGVITLKDDKIEAIQSGLVVLATRGYASIYHGHSTNAAEPTGDGVAMALRAGARLSDMEFVQFHPTSLSGS